MTAPHVRAEGQDAGVNDRAFSAGAPGVAIREPRGVTAC